MQKLHFTYEPHVQHIEYKGIRADVLRLDLITKHGGGNKFFKLKLNLDAAKLSGLKVLTFGGAHSNHIYAAAQACKQSNLNLIVVVRGEENEKELSPTLEYAKFCESILHFVSRRDYAKKTDETFLHSLKEKFGDYYLVPEGGANYHGVAGCAGIMTPKLRNYKNIFCAAGTGTTFAGICAAATDHQLIHGIAVISKGGDIIPGINKWLLQSGKDPVELLKKNDLSKSGIFTDYTFGGYAKHTDQLLEFKKDFELQTHIKLDYVYTAKLFYAAFDLLKINNVQDVPLIIHSGGLQGNEAYEKRFGL